eukprot:1662241-Pyramimonas_sp.AAC.2
MLGVLSRNDTNARALAYDEVACEDEPKKVEKVHLRMERSCLPPAHLYTTGPLPAACCLLPTTYYCAERCESRVGPEHDSQEEGAVRVLSLSGPRARGACGT